MAAAKQKTRTVTTTERVLPEEVVVTQEPKADKDEADSRDLVELGGGATSGNRWVVKCISPMDKAGHCCEVPHGELNLARIAEAYGAGKYEFRLINPHGEYVTQRTITLRASAKSTDTPTTTQPMSALLDPMVQLLLQQSKDQVTMLTGVLTTALQRPQPAIADPLEMLVKLKTLLPEQKSSSEMDLFLRGVEFAKDLQGSGGETNWLDLLGQGLKHVGPLIANGIQSTPAPVADQTPVRALPSQPRQNTSATVHDVSATQQRSAERHQTIPTVPNTENNPMLKLLNWLRTQTNALVYQASRQKNPQLYAEVFVDNLPDFVPVADMLQRLKTPGAIAQLAQLNPAVSQFPEWFEDFRVSVIQIIESESAPQTPQSNNSGDTPTTIVDG